MGKDLFKILPMKRLTAFKENVQKLLGDELIDKSFPLLGCELGPLARSAICVTKRAVHAAGLGDADRQFERLFEFGDALGCNRVSNSHGFVHVATFCIECRKLIGP